MKRIALLLSLLLMVCIASAALGEATATLVRENLADTDWIDDTCLLAVEGDPINNYRAYSMNTLDGTPLTEAIYADLDGKMGYVIATSLKSADLMNADGLLDLSGNVLIPCEYGKIDVLSTEWAVAIRLLESTAENYDYSAWFSDAKYLIDTVDVYHLPEGNKLATLTRSEYSDADAVNHCINIENRATGEVTTYDASFAALGTVGYTFSDDFAPADYEKFYENRHYGIKDAEGNVVLEPTYSIIYTAYQGVSRAEADDGKSGLITERGDLLIPAEYDDFISTYHLPDVAGKTSGYIAAGYAAVKMDGKLGYVDLNNNVTCEPKYVADNMDVRGASATVADPLTGNLIMVAADGVESIIEGYDNVYPLSFGSGVFYRVNDSNYNYGIIDWHGNVVIPCEYKGVELSSDGMYALVEVDYHTANLYALTYPASTFATFSVENAAAGNEAPAEEAPAAVEDAAPAQENAASSPVKTLLDNASTLLSTDAATNASAAVGLLKSASMLLSGNDAALNLLNSAINLLETDPATNAVAVTTLLESVAALL